MIYCYCDNFFERSNYPKFYKQAVAVMRGANNIAFSRKEDFDVFVHRLKTRLEADKPKGHAASWQFFSCHRKRGMAISTQRK